jgi:hypothetical protein
LNRPLRGAGSLLAWFGLALAPPWLPAQGPVYRDHWAFLHLEQRRAEVLAGLPSLSAEARAAVAQAMAGPDQGVPFGQVASALAMVRGAECDPQYLMRVSLGAFVLPEVADPEATKEECRSTNVSLFLGAGTTLPAACAFTIQLRAADGKLVFEQAITEGTALDDLRRAKPAVRIPSAELPDGRYEVEVRTRFDEKAPPDHAPRLRWSCHVLRGYQARAEAAMAAAQQALPGLSGGARALVAAALAAVVRAYAGEAWVVTSNAVDDLVQLEGALRAVAAKQPLRVEPGHTWLTFTPADGRPLQVVVRKAPGEGPAPLLLVVGGTPSYDTTARRPLAPLTRHPGWLAAELAAFAASRPWHVAFVESPGGGRDFVPALRHGLGELRALLAIDGVGLVAEREAAVVVGLRLHELAGELRGAVLCGAAALPMTRLGELASLPIRFLRLAGYPGSETMQQSLERLRSSPAAAGADIGWLVTEELPWPFGLPLAAPAMEAWFASRFAP